MGSPRSEQLQDGLDIAAPERLGPGDQDDPIDDRPDDRRIDDGQQRRRVEEDDIVGLAGLVQQLLQAGRREQLGQVGDLRVDGDHVEVLDLGSLHDLMQGQQVLEQVR